MKELPPHIIQKNETWFLNTKTGKYLHKDYLPTYVENWYKYHSPDVAKAKVRQKQDFKYAKMRHFDKED